jgi:iron(III) transport system substrate-binding protein
MAKSCYRSLRRASNEITLTWMCDGSDMGSQDVLDRVRSEKENPQADVWWGAPSTLFQQAEKEGLLQVYRPSWVSEVTAEARSAGDFWYGTYETPGGHCL